MPIKRKRGLDVAVTLPQYFKENGYMTLGTLWLACSTHVQTFNIPEGMGKVWHPGMPNTPVGDDYPKSWSEKVQTVFHPVIPNQPICNLDSFTQMFHTNSTDDPSNSWKAYTEEEMEETTLRCKEDILQTVAQYHQGHSEYRLHPRETEGACTCSISWRTELLYCLRSSQGGLKSCWYTFDLLPPSPASSALGLSSWVLWSLSWGCGWLAG